MLIYGSLYDRPHSAAAKTPTTDDTSMQLALTLFIFQKKSPEKSTTTATQTNWQSSMFRENEIEILCLKTDIMRIPS